MLAFFVTMSSIILDYLYCYYSNCPKRFGPYSTEHKVEIKMYI